MGCGGSKEDTTPSGVAVSQALQVLRPTTEGEEVKAGAEVVLKAAQEDAGDSDAGKVRISPLRGVFPRLTPPQPMDPNQIVVKLVKAPDAKELVTNLNVSGTGITRLTDLGALARLTILDVRHSGPYRRCTPELTPHPGTGVEQQD